MTKPREADDSSATAQRPDLPLPPTTRAPLTRLLLVWALLGTIVAAVTGIDQVSKSWAQHDLVAAGGRVPLLHGKAWLVAFTYVRNPGAAWGLFAGADESFRRPFFFLVSLAAIGFILFLYHRLHASQLLARIALALILGGAVGNFIDRLRYGYVIDFIDLRYGSLRWPTFNIADAAISCGVALLLIEMLWGSSVAQPLEPDPPPE